MNARLLCPLSFLALVTDAAAQDFIHYKFDDDVANEVINFAYGPGAFPANGVLESNATSASLTDGRFGQALVGGDPAAGRYHRVRSGWVPSQQPLLGDLTLAFWLRERTPNASLTVLSGTTLAAGMRVFTGGPTGRGLYVRAVVANGGNGSSPVDLRLPPSVVDVQSRAAVGWTHVAVVVDSAAATAQWFIDGTPVLLVQGCGPARIASTGEFLIGFQGTQNVSNYDHDEYLISRRAYTATEIAWLATAPRAGEGSFTSGLTSQCGAVDLHSYGGEPVFGNPNYGLELDCRAQGLFVLVMGFDRVDFGNSVPLPVQLGPFAPGCWLLTDLGAKPYVGHTRGGAVRVPVQLPGPTNVDLGMFVQGAVLGGGPRGSMQASMGLAIHLGR